MDHEANETLTSSKYRESGGGGEFTYRDSIATPTDVTKSERQSECAKTIGCRIDTIVCRKDRSMDICALHTRHATQETGKHRGWISAAGQSREGMSDRFKRAKCDHVHGYRPKSK